MDPDSGGYFNSSMLFKASVISITFTTFCFYRSGKQFSFLKMPAVKTDSSLVAKPAEKPPAKKKKKKTIYLSFDDGPDKGTGNVMAIIKEEQIPVTMFIIGEHVYGSHEQKVLWDSLLQNSLFEIANHSYTHAFRNRFNKFYSEPDSAVKDFERCADSLDLRSRIIRTPGRNIWRTENISSTDLRASQTTADSLYSKGFTEIGWDLEWHYNAGQSLVQSDSMLISQIDSIFAGRRTKTPDHLVLLAHDRTFLRPDDSASLHRFIKELKRKDEYDFETVSKYPGISGD